MDWKAVIAELLDVHGMSQPQIAAVCNCAQSSISAIARGETKDPRHSIGDHLLSLLEEKRRGLAAQAASAAREHGSGCANAAR